MDGSERQSVTHTLSEGALGQLMPLHAVVSAEGRITGIGPTLARIAPAGTVTGMDFFELFRIRRPNGIADMRSFVLHAGRRLDLAFRQSPETVLRGLAVPLGAGELLVNLSFGIGLIEAVRRHDLTEADFPPTDLAIEMLYLVEAKSAVMKELRDLNLRLQGAKTVAEEQAITDALTGLRNRRGLEANLVRLAAQGVAFGLMHVDLDYFKAVNDQFGHAAGDHVLCKVAEILISETRSGDTVARIGGDEFVIILAGLTDAERMVQIARRMIAHLAEPIAYQGQDCHISASIGVVLSNQYPTPDLDRMVADADAALYASKNAGRATVSMGHP